MPKKKPKYPLIGELKLGKSVEDVIKEHFSDYAWSECFPGQVPDIVREIIRIGKPQIQFAVESTEDEARIIVLNAESGLCLDYSDINEDDVPIAHDEEAYEDCAVLNRVVRRLYGLKKRSPAAVITPEQFMKCDGKVCPYCEGVVLATLDDTGRESVTMGCRSCGATWETSYEVSVSGFKYWRHGR